MNKKLSKSLIQLCELLSDGRFHNGTHLGETLHLSRAAIWKHIKKLTHYGILIESIKGKGYQLKNPLLLIDAEKIAALTQRSDFYLHVFEQIDSTNTYLKQLALDRIKHICIAEQQLQGRGRLSRTWHSPFGSNIYCSIRYPFKKDLAELSGLSLVIALSTCRVINTFLPSGESCHVKWPNDVINHQEKLAGNLIDIQAESHGESLAIIGIGINVNMETNTLIDQAWTTMAQINQAPYNRNPILAKLIETILTDLDTFSDHGLAAFQTSWAQHDILQAKEISVSCENKTIEGVVEGIDSLGRLQLRTQQGGLLALSSGTTRIKKSSL
jgi:BirA family biotin operon repressor/biotin-[acetyl-CoA-carboxylase] ligase